MSTLRVHSIVTAAVPSRSSLLEAINKKVAEAQVVIHPSVSDQMLAIRRARRGAEDEEVRIVTAIDLFSVCKKSIVKDCTQTDTRESGWDLQLLGVDATGDPLAVSVHLPASDDEPLRIVGFVMIMEDVVELAN
jgi:hypothetical protein